MIVMFVGVYKEPDCMWKAQDLDHAVTLVGYGTSPQGEDYWLIKYDPVTNLNPCMLVLHLMNQLSHFPVLFSLWGHGLLP